MIVFIYTKNQIIKKLSVKQKLSWIVKLMNK